MLRPIANPFALGFLGLAGATLVASGVELSWVPAAQRHEAAVLILAFAPPLQVISCIFGFLARDATAATGAGVLAGSWAAIGFTLLVTRAGAVSESLALLLLVAVCGAAFSAITAVRSKGVPAAVLGLAAVRFLLTALFEFGDGAGWRQAAGWTGVALCGLALYAALSLELEDDRRHTVLPTLRRGAARRALHADLDQQVEEVAAEAGVRSQL